jgi:hypothetical protein
MKGKHSHFNTPARARNSGHVPLRLLAETVPKYRVGKISTSLIQTVQRSGPDASTKGMFSAVKTTTAVAVNNNALRQSCAVLFSSRSDRYARKAIRPTATATPFVCVKLVAKPTHTPAPAIRMPEVPRIRTHAAAMISTVLNQ